MTLDRYMRERSKIFRNLADHCHDKALKENSPRLVANWVVLLDALLWCASPDGDMSLLESIAKPVKENNGE